LVSLLVATGVVRQAVKVRLPASTALAVFNKRRLQGLGWTRFMVLSRLKNEKGAVIPMRPHGRMGR
jgi:hypothetical protein